MKAIEGQQRPRSIKQDQIGIVFLISERASSGTEDQTESDRIRQDQTGSDRPI